MHIARHMWSRSRLGQFVDDELDPALAARVQVHLDECIHCRAEVSSLLGLKTALVQRLGRRADAETVARLQAWATDELPTLSQ